MKALSTGAEGDCRVYLTGGATAVLEGWRPSTIDVDMRLVPEDESLLRSLPKIKESLDISLELAWPGQFIPEVPGWEERSRFIAKEGRLTFYHYDPYSQALAKIERGHRQDLLDAREMVRRGLVDIKKLLSCFEAIEEQLFRFPAVDPAGFRKKVGDFISSST